MTRAWDDLLMTTTQLLQTPLGALMQELGGKMVPFAGYAMPVQFAPGVRREHLWTRENCGLFDVSHMGQARLRGDNPAKSLEKLVPGNMQGLAANMQRYTVLLNQDGGIIDDLMVSRPDDDGLMLVVNAACKDKDYARIETGLAGLASLEPIEDRALIAVQGPKTAEIFAKFMPAACDMVFMQCGHFSLFGEDVIVSRSGYTGEDGFEISLPSASAEDVVREILADERVLPIGLGARDSLRLEAGLCLSGHDFTEAQTPIGAGLAWAVPKLRRERADFPGAKRILGELAATPTEKRVGICPLGKAPAREGTQIASGGEIVGRITSGGFGPSFGGPVSMGYVRTDLAEIGNELELLIRGKTHPAKVVAMPFVEQNYYRGKGA
ncbi:Aminomethyltransferase (glycine cleavage system T protein) [hydrothermal vent metagenome]|uniref:aminomethyltransferase n=1 Tax=hydrothermal vent metagenome TaxID=652676 RepID=A0A3B0RDH3_9ZZZZ